ncbi:Auxin response factor 4 [Hordeum vulgare]|nr:Auxin response factor 4 [Hordeum vulgare]
MQIEAEIQAHASPALLGVSLRTRRNGGGGGATGGGGVGGHGGGRPEEGGRPEIHALGLNMAKAGVEFVVAQADKMTEQQVILDSIRDEAEVESNRRHIRQRQAGADALFDELEAKIAAKEAATDQPEASEGAQ